MAEEVIKTIRHSIQYWYIPLIVGIIFIGIGILTFSSPMDTFLALSFLFSISFLFSGFAEVLFSIINRGELDNWGWTLIFGVFTFIVGLLLIIDPALSMITLSFYIGFMVLTRSIGAISFAIDLSNYGIKDWVGLLAVGVIGVILGFIMIWNPSFASASIVVWTGMALIATGVFNVYLAIRLSKLRGL